jgi:hypothetical protein
MKFSLFPHIALTIIDCPILFPQGLRLLQKSFTAELAEHAESNTAISGLSDLCPLGGRIIGLEMHLKSTKKRLYAAGWSASSIKTIDRRTWKSVPQLLGSIR